MSRFAHPAKHRLYRVEFSSDQSSLLHLVPEGPVVGHPAITLEVRIPAYNRSLVSHQLCKFLWEFVAKDANQSPISLKPDENGCDLSFFFICFF